MGTTDIAMERIFRALISGNVGVAIAEAETYLAAWPNPQTSERLNAVKVEYNLMEDYWQQGFKDNQLGTQYQRLLQRVYVICANISVARHLASSSYLQGLNSSVRQSGRNWSIDVIRSEMESFVTDVAMLELEPEHRRKEKSQQLYQQHQQQMNALFNYIVTSRIWTEGISQAMEEILLSPTIDSIDQQLLTSAVMLSLMNRFDIMKFRLLVNLYRCSHDEQVRQRALVGWVLSIDDDFLELYPEQRELVMQLLQSKRACRELTELQMQLVYTLNAENDTTTIRKEIMPDLLQNNKFRITHNGIEEIEDDPLEDILNPDASELRMERLEKSYQRMLDMQRQGADIYFGGFSQMKRFPFFYEMSNWFVPFYLQHPDISQFVDKIGCDRFLEGLLKQGSFCNNDKYSLVMALQQVVRRLPDSILQMMKRGEASMGDDLSSEELQSPAFVRRSYLMDLYRFFRLFPNRSALCNPFDTSNQELGMCLFFGSGLFRGTPLEQNKREVVAMLMKKRLTHSAMRLLDTFPESMHDVQYFLWKGDYSKALQLEPNHERALIGHAREAFAQGRYEQAEEDYDSLLLLQPDKSQYLLNKAVCLIRMEEYEDALRLLYQLNYEYPDDDNVARVLAWAQTCNGKCAQAEKIYQQLVADGHASGEDYQNFGYCLWLAGRLVEAAANFRKSYEAIKAETPSFLSFFDEDWLQKRGISKTDIKMMTALVAKG